MPSHPSTPGRARARSSPSFFGTFGGGFLISLKSTGLAPAARFFW